MLKLIHFQKVSDLYQSNNAMLNTAIMTISSTFLLVPVQNKQGPVLLKIPVVWVLPSHTCLKLVILVNTINIMSWVFLCQWSIVGALVLLQVFAVIICTAVNIWMPTQSYISEPAVSHDLGTLNRVHLEITSHFLFNITDSFTNKDNSMVVGWFKKSLRSFVTILPVLATFSFHCRQV